MGTDGKKRPRTDYQKASKPEAILQPPRSIGPRHARPNAATAAIVGTSGIGDATGYSLSAYPVPATTEVTVTSPEAIRDIRVFSSTGAEVALVAGEDSYTQSVDVSTLASGVYMIVINEQTPIRIVKK